MILRLTWLLKGYRTLTSKSITSIILGTEGSSDYELDKEWVLRSRNSNAKSYNESLCNRLERNWNDHLTRVEFSYDNRSYVSIEVSPYEILEGRQCRSPLC